MLPRYAQLGKIIHVLTLLPDDRINILRPSTDLRS